MNSPSKKHLAASSRLRAKKRKIAPADGASGGVREGWGVHSTWFCVKTCSFGMRSQRLAK